jgi:hypothetical protein
MDIIIDTNFITQVTRFVIHNNDLVIQAYFI